MSAAALVWGVGLSLVLVACAGTTVDGGSATTAEPGPELSAEPTVTAPPSFSGPADSDFCLALDEVEDLPVLDPFAVDLDPDEVDLRMRALVIRSNALAEVAPDVLVEDLSTVARALTSLDRSLSDHDHDLEAAAEAGVDLSAADDPVFVEIAIRIDAYRVQVCESSDEDLNNP